MMDSRDALVFGPKRSGVGAVEVWLRRLRVVRPGISAQRKRALAAAGGGMWRWLQQQRPSHIRNSNAARTKPLISVKRLARIASVRAVASGCGGARFGDPGRQVMNWWSAGAGHSMRLAWSRRSEERGWNRHPARSVAFAARGCQRPEA